MEKITVSEVAEALGIDDQTVRVMSEQGLLLFMVPTNRKEDKNRCSYVVFPNLFRLFVTGFEDSKETAAMLFIFANIMKELQELRVLYGHNAKGA